jgi:hypothetical protein
MPASLASPFLSERLIARMSSQRRANLTRRVREHLRDAAVGAVDNDSTQDDATATRLVHILGRLSALTA